MAQMNENIATAPVSPLRDFFAKPRIIARPGFNRWLVPPAALAVHLCIGMAYGFSVYWLPMSQLIGGSESLQCPVNMSFWQQLFTRDCDWKIHARLDLHAVFCFSRLFGGAVGQLA